MKLHSSSIEACGHCRKCDYAGNDEVQVTVAFDGESSPQTVTESQQVQDRRYKCCRQSLEPVPTEKSQVHPQYRINVV